MYNRKIVNPSLVGTNSLSEYVSAQDFNTPTPEAKKDNQFLIKTICVTLVKLK